MVFQSKHTALIKAIKHMKKIKKMRQFPYLSPFFHLQISIDYNPHQFSRVRYKSQKAIKSTKTLWIL